MRSEPTSTISVNGKVVAEGWTATGICIAVILAIFLAGVLVGSAS